MNHKEVSENIKIEQNRVAKAEKLERLFANEDFKDIILSEFMKDLVLQSIYNKNMTSSTDLKHIENISISINLLNNFFNSIISSKETAEMSIAELNKIQYSKGY